jgi:hypothetical protein
MKLSGKGELVLEKDKVEIRKQVEVEVLRK